MADERKMQTEKRRTPLYGWHTGHGANMGEFAGFQMPLWFPRGAKGEHLAVIGQAGIFDTSHMSVLTVRGPGALDLLQFCLTRNLLACQPPRNSPLEKGRSAYGVFLNPEGGCVDDAIVLKLAEDEFLVVVNAGMGPVVSAHLEAHMQSRSAGILDLSGKVGKMDVQGPMAAGILRKVLADPERVLLDMPYFSFKGHFDPSSPLCGQVTLADHTPLLLSRTGYTGEFGFELFVVREDLVKVWELLLDAGQDFGLTPCGLAARDSLRVGAVLPLSHQDIGPWPFINHPWEFVLPFNADRTGFMKTFLGGEAILKQAGAEHTYPFVGYDVRKVADRGQAEVLDPSGVQIGVVLSCATDMAIGWHDGRIYSIASPNRPQGFNPTGLCCGFVRCRSGLDPGQVVDLRDRRRTIKVLIVRDIRPDRTARRPMREMLWGPEQASG